VRARSRYSDAHTMHDAATVALMCGRISIGIGKVEVLGEGEDPQASSNEPGDEGVRS